jgi:hypothetical protein
MRKISLDLHRLDVQSFSTADDAPSAAGTVRAHLATEGCNTFLHEGCGPTQFNSCAWTRLGAPCICSN